MSTIITPTTNLKLFIGKYLIIELAINMTKT